MITATVKEIDRKTNEYGVTFVRELEKVTRYGKTSYTVKYTTIFPDGNESKCWGKVYKDKKAFCKWYDLPMEIFD